MAHRSERMRAELGRRRTVTEAIYEAGFNSNGRFYANSSEILGMEAKAYRNGGTGATIRFAVSECSLGSILVAASERGVCAIFLGDDAADAEEGSREAISESPLHCRGSGLRTTRCQCDPFRRSSANRLLICRSIYAEPFSSAECGRLSARSPLARPRVIRRSPIASAHQSQFAPLPGRLLRIGWRWSSPATEFCAGTGVFPATAGESNARCPCCKRSKSRRTRKSRGLFARWPQRSRRQWLLARRWSGIR